MPPKGNIAHQGSGYGQSNIKETFDFDSIISDLPGAKKPSVQEAEKPAEPGAEPGRVQEGRSSSEPGWVQAQTAGTPSWARAAEAVGLDEMERRREEKSRRREEERRQEERRREEEQRQEEERFAEASTMAMVEAYDAAEDRGRQEQQKAHDRVKLKMAMDKAYESVPGSAKLLDNVLGMRTVPADSVDANELQEQNGDTETGAPARTANPEDDIDVYGFTSASSAGSSQALAEEDVHSMTPDPPKGDGGAPGEMRIQSLPTAKAPARKFSKVKSRVEDAVQGIFERKRWTGRAFAEKAIASRDVDPNAVRISTDIVREIIREPKNNLVDIVNKVTGESFVAEDIVLSESEMARFAKAINDNEIFVIGSKSPVAYAMSSQRRVLKVSGKGRGVEVHPTQTKVYNMDFDGDQVRIQFASGEGMYANAMEYLISPYTGKPMIDEDFFPIAKISENREEYRMLFSNMFFRNVGKDERSTAYTDAIADAFYGISNKKKGDDSDRLWADAIHAMEAFADGYLGDRNRYMSYLLKDVFDNMREIRNIQAGVVSIASTYEGNEENPYDHALTMVIDDIAFGNTLPANYQDFVNALGHYLGEIPGKNAEFRIGAGIAKRINASRQTFKGEEGMIELMDLTLKAAQARRMNSRIAMAEARVKISEVVYTNIVKAVGFPNDRGRYNAPTRAEAYRMWVAAFVREYDYWSEIARMSGIEFSTDGKAIASSINDKPRGKTLRDYINPIVNVYGEYTMEALFNGVVDFESEANGYLRKYRGYKLRTFMQRNDLLPNFTETGKKSVFDATPQDILSGIADKRTAAAGDFKRSLLKLGDEMVKTWSKFQATARSYVEDGRINREVFINESEVLMEGLYSSGKEMFSYFGMEDAEQFANSEWGKRFRRASEGQVYRDRYGKQHAKNEAVDAVLGQRVAMVTQYRLRSIAGISSRIDTAYGPAEINRINRLQAELDREADILASSSELWTTLVAELRGDTRAFDDLKEHHGHPQTMQTYVEDVSKDGFWKHEDITGKYSSLLDVMLDPDLGRSLKMAVAIDVVRIHTGMRDRKVAEMDYQLEIGPSENFSSLTTMTYRESPDILSEIQAATKKMKRNFDESWNNMARSVRKARSMFGSEGQLTSYLRSVAGNPQLYAYVPPAVVVDMLNAQMRKSSSSSEKNAQEIPVNADYGSLSVQSGGFTNVMSRCEMRVLGYVYEGNISALDVVNALADPEFSLTVYNGEGEYELSRRVLCGSNSEKAVWDFLESNPFAASIVRPGIVTTSKGEVYRNARYSFEDGMGHVLNHMSPEDSMWDAVYAYLIEKPMFRALVSMFPPIEGKRPETVADAREDMLGYMQLLLMSYAEKAKENVVTAEDVLDSLGITRAVDPTSPDFDDGNPSTLSIIGGMDDLAAFNFYSQLEQEVMKYVQDVNYMMSNREYDFAALREKHEPESVNLVFDRSSLRLALDNHQTATGEKTERSTAVEGNMTSQFNAFSMYTMSMTDGFTVIDSTMTPDEISMFNGMMTNAGAELTADNLEQLEEIADANGEPLVVMVPDGYDASDASLSYDDDFQMPAVGRYMGLKRKFSTEEGNLKAKKSGDDGKDSILKNSRYNPSARQNIGIIDRVYHESDEGWGRFNAIMELARMLQRFDVEEGYKDMDLGDYANIASLMVREAPDEDGNPGIKIVPIGMMTAAVQDNMDTDTMLNGSAADILGEVTEIVESAGNDNIGDEYKGAMARLAVSRIKSNVAVGTFSAPKDYSMSSKERNFAQLVKLFMQKENTEVPGIGEVEGKKIENAPNEQQVNEASAKVSKESGFPNPEGGYKYIAYVNEDGFADIGNGGKPYVKPGQLSVWILEEGASGEMVKEAVSKCYTYGMTLAFKNLAALGSLADVYAEDVQRAPFYKPSFDGDQCYCLPFYSIRLNGGNCTGPMAPPSFQYHPSTLWFQVEDPSNIYGLADGESLVSDDVYRSTRCGARGVETVEFDDLFYATRLAYGYDVSRPEYVTRQEIREQILAEGSDAQIDFGIPEQNGYYVDGTVTEKYKLLLEEYRREFERSNDPHGFLAEGKPDRIIGWMKCKPNGFGRYVYAPVVLWPTGSKLNVPTKFSIVSRDKIESPVNLNRMKDQLELSWELSEDLDGQTVKLHSGDSGADKSFIKFRKGQDLGALQSGHRVSSVAASESFASRKTGSDKRMCTLRSLAMMMQQPPYGYNFAELPGAFPDNPEVKEELMAGRISKEKWDELYPQIERYYDGDPEVDSLVRNFVRDAVKTPTVNPSDILACSYMDEADGQARRMYTYPYVDWEFFMGTTLQYQNSLMKWFNLMQPTVCPPSIDGYEDDRGYIFKPVSDRSMLMDKDTVYDYGCLQMNYRGVWSNVYITFAYFNDEISSMHKVGLNGAVQSMEQINAAAMSGRVLPDREMRLFAQNAASPSIRTEGPNDVELDYGRYLGKER